MGRLDGSISIVTGAARGIGLACAHALAERGPLLAVDLHERQLDEAVEALRARGVDAQAMACDLSEPGAIEAIANRVDEADGLAALAHAAALSGSMADARRILEVNLTATARLVDALEPHLLEGSAAVLIASQAAYFVGPAVGPEGEALLAEPLRPHLYARLAEELGALATASQGAYGISKRGVQLLAVSRAPAWGARGARIVSVSPGIIDTEMGGVEFEANTAAMQKIVDSTPVGARRGRANEIAAAVAFLCSEAASFVSGVDLLVDGGSTHQIRRD